jgi:hypothetical protein
MVRHLCNGKIPFVVLALWTVCLLPGCSGTRSYPRTAHSNLQVRTTTDSGSWFSGVRVAVDIHGVGQDCRVHYEGTVQLTQPTIDVGIPPNRWTQLVFVFASSSFLAGRSGMITYDTLLKPRAGYHYQITVSYKNDIYHVAIRETQPNQSAGLEIERRPLSACRSNPARI